MNIKFQKFCGCGNDFVIIDNRDFKKMIKCRADFSKKFCQRGLSVGADGIIFLENSTIADFKMVLFQPDGSEAEMCGNGARCVAKYAFINGIANKDMKFETLAGIIEAHIVDENNVSVKLTSPFDLKLDETLNIETKKISYDFINTGVPHSIVFTDNLKNYDVFNIGKSIRFHNNFKPDGTNVNFVKINKKNEISIRTYERGVENETLACGTGSTAAALITAYKNNFDSPVSVNTKSNVVLKIHFSKENLLKKNLESLELFLEGDASLIYSAEMNIEKKYFGA